MKLWKLQCLAIDVFDVGLAIVTALSPLILLAAVAYVVSTCVLQVSYP